MTPMYVPLQKSKGRSERGSQFHVVTHRETNRYYAGLWHVLLYPSRGLKETGGAAQTVGTREASERERKVVALCLLAGSPSSSFVRYVPTAAGMGRVSKRIKQRQAAAEAAELVQLNREQDADTAANIEKLRWEKGRHFNVFEVRSVVHAKAASCECLGPAPILLKVLPSSSLSFPISLFGVLRLPPPPPPPLPLPTLQWHLISHLFLFLLLDHLLRWTRDPSASITPCILIVLYPAPPVVSTLLLICRNSACSGSTTAR